MNSRLVSLSLSDFPFPLLFALLPFPFSSFLLSFLPCPFVASFFSTFPVEFRAEQDRASSKDVASRNIIHAFPPGWRCSCSLIKSKFKVRGGVWCENRGEGGKRRGDGRSQPTVIASPPACLKIDVIFVILSTLLPRHPHVSRTSACGHLFLHAYKLTSTLLHMATPSFRGRIPRSRDLLGCK